MVKTRAFEKMRQTGPQVKVVTDNSFVPKERGMEDTSNGAIEVVNPYQELIS